MMYHTAVLLKESIEGLNILPDGIYADVTFGSGAHSREILSRLKNGHLYSFDQDPDAAINLIQDERFTFIPENFRYLKNFLRLNGLSHLNGILADLGISSHQIDQPERGFSVRFDGPLNMRMDQSNEADALSVINYYDEHDLIRLFREYGEISNAGLLSKNIVRHRQESLISTTSGLKQIALETAQRGKENQYLSKVFQAIRIEVNDEINALKDMLTQAVSLLDKGGRLVVISYHSLEDRLVKNYFRSNNFEGIIEKDFYGNPLTDIRPVNRKAIMATEEEIRSNNRARSARLRIAEKI